MLSPCVCPAVCLSVCVCVCDTPVLYQIKTAKRRIMQITPYDSSGTLVYQYRLESRIYRMALLIASRGPSALAELLVNFGCCIHISGKAEARAFKLCTKGDYIKSDQRDDKSPLKGAWFCSRDPFLPRDRYAKRGICRRRVSVCVCVSVTLQYCIKAAKRRITQTTPHDSP